MCSKKRLACRNVEWQCSKHSSSEHPQKKKRPSVLCTRNPSIAPRCMYEEVISVKLCLHGISKRNSPVDVGGLHECVPAIHNLCVEVTVQAIKTGRDTQKHERHSTPPAFPPYIRQTTYRYKDYTAVRRGQKLWNLPRYDWLDFTIYPVSQSHAPTKSGKNNALLQRTPPAPHRAPGRSHRTACDSTHITLFSSLDPTPI